MYDQCEISQVSFQTRRWKVFQQTAWPHHSRIILKQEGISHQQLHFHFHYHTLFLMNYTSTQNSYGKRPLAMDLENFNKFKDEPEQRKNCFRKDLLAVPLPYLSTTITSGPPWTLKSKKENLVIKISEKHKHKLDWAYRLSPSVFNNQFHTWGKLLNFNKKELIILLAMISPVLFFIFSTAKVGLRRKA